MRQVLQYFDGQYTLQEMQPDSLGINTSTESNEAFQFVMLFSYSFRKYSANSLSNDESIFNKGC